MKTDAVIWHWANQGNAFLNATFLQACLYLRSNIYKPAPNGEVEEKFFAVGFHNLLLLWLIVAKDILPEESKLLTITARARNILFHSVKGLLPHLNPRKSLMMFLWYSFYLTMDLPLPDLLPAKQMSTGNPHIYFLLVSKI